MRAGWPCCLKRHELSAGRRDAGRSVSSPSVWKRRTCSVAVRTSASLQKTRQSILGAIVLECVGYARSEAGSQQTPPHLPIAIPSIGDFLGVVGNEASRHLVAAIMSCGSATIPSLKMIPMTVPGKGELLPDTRRSDHAAFWDQGYPAVMLTDTANFRNPNYHQPTDTIETLNLDFLSDVAAVVTAAVMNLAGPSTL